MTTTAILAAVLAVPLAFSTPEEASRRKALEHNRSAEQLMRTERFAQAAEEFTQAITLDPLLVSAHYGLGQAYMALKLYPKAVDAFKATEEAVMKVGSLGAKAREELEKQNDDEIRELRNSIVALQGGRIKDAAADQMIMKIEERIRLLEDMKGKGREVQRVPAEVHLGLGSAYFRQNMLPEAEAAYTQAVRTNNKLGAAHNNLAVIYMLSGRFPQANASVEAAEKAGFRVDPRLKADIKAREAAAGKS
jgi:tetratricopeptide (TPR) repeat protein